MAMSPELYQRFSSMNNTERLDCMTQLTQELNAVAGRMGGAPDPLPTIAQVTGMKPSDFAFDCYEIGLKRAKLELVLNMESVDEGMQEETTHVDPQLFVQKVAANVSYTADAAVRHAPKARNAFNSFMDLGDGLVGAMVFIFLFFGAILSVFDLIEWLK